MNEFGRLILKNKVAKIDGTMLLFVKIKFLFVGKDPPDVTIEFQELQSSKSLAVAVYHRSESASGQITMQSKGVMDAIVLTAYDGRPSDQLMQNLMNDNVTPFHVSARSISTLTLLFSEIQCRLWHIVSQSRTHNLSIWYHIWNNTSK